MINDGFDWSWPRPSSGWMSPWKQFIFCLASLNVLICSVQSTNEHRRKAYVNLLPEQILFIYISPFLSLDLLEETHCGLPELWSLLKMFLSATSGPSDWTIINSIRKKGTVTVCQLKDCHFFDPTFFSLLFPPVKTCARKCPLCPSPAAVTDGKISSFTSSRDSSFQCLKILKPRQ